VNREQRTENREQREKGKGKKEKWLLFEGSAK
jgi:hypothetical protein